MYIQKGKQGDINTGADDDEQWGNEYGTMCGSGGNQNT